MRSKPCLAKQPSRRQPSFAAGRLPGSVGNSMAETWQPCGRAAKPAALTESGRTHQLTAAPIRLRTYAPALDVFHRADDSRTRSPTCIGVGRITVVRMLAEARARNEVKIAIESELSGDRQAGARAGACVRSAAGYRRAAVQCRRDLHTGDQREDQAPPSSEVMRPGMRVGVGWGRTLFSALLLRQPKVAARLRRSRCSAGRRGAPDQPSRVRPARRAGVQGEGYLIPAPAVGRQRRDEDRAASTAAACRIFRMTEDLDAGLLSIGGIASATTSTVVASSRMRGARGTGRKRGAVGDCCLHWGELEWLNRAVDHPIKQPGDVGGGRSPGSAYPDPDAGAAGGKRPMHWSAH